MVDLKSMSESELLERKNMYIKRLEKLQNNIEKYIHGETDLRKEILSEYAELKRAIREESSYLDKDKNSMYDVSDTHNSYQWGIMEANAYGFGARVNSKINQDMFNAVSEAIYKIDKYFE